MLIYNLLPTLSQSRNGGCMMAHVVGFFLFFFLCLSLDKVSVACYNSLSDEILFQLLKAGSFL